jgi:hypothetical protein
MAPAAAGPMAREHRQLHGSPSQSWRQTVQVTSKAHRGQCHDRTGDPERADAGGAGLPPAGAARHVLPVTFAAAGGLLAVASTNRLTMGIGAL